MKFWPGKYIYVYVQLYMNSYRCKTNTYTTYTYIHVNLVGWLLEFCINFFFFTDLVFR